MKRKACPGLLKFFIVFLSVAAALPASAAEPEFQVDQVVVGLETDGQTLAPWAFQNFGKVEMLLNIYESLCRINSDGSSTNVMMESVKKIDDLTYHIRIYDYIYDWAGNHIKASDVVFSINSYVEKGNKGGVKSMKSVRVIDDYMIEWKNSVPFAVGQMYKEFSNPKIVSEAAYKLSPNGMATDPVGTAPYKLTKYIPGNSITLEATGKYWQKDKSKYASTSYTNAKKLVFQIILDSSQMAMALQSGSIDLAGNLNISDLPFFEKDKNFRVVEIPSVKPWLLIPNPSSSSPCQDINLRMAIFYALNADDMVAALTVKSQAVSSISNPTQADFLPEWKNRDYWKHSVAKAKQYLRKSSYKGQRLKLVCMNGDIPTGLAMVIQAQLNDIGIKVDIESLDNAMYRSKMPDPKGYDLLINENGGGPYCPQCWNNVFSYRDKKTFNTDPKLQTLLDNAALKGAPNDLRAFQNYIDEMAYGRGLIIPTIRTASKAWITNVFLGTDNNILINASTFRK